MPTISERQVVHSALWAAYGDAVGFPTELISEHDFEKRTGQKCVDGTMHWSKRVGGLFGPEILFPRGSYSDDTQLRLSVSRSIAGDGFFDVESFAKIELPVWLNYALGAGRASKLAAANLALKESTWSQNFFQSTQVQYWNGGGNGAVMRIQPHVWAGHSHDPAAFMGDVVRNAVCTHGHPRAIIGAAIHAQCLYAALRSGRSSAPKEWAELGSIAAGQARQSLLDDEELSLVWVPYWQQRSGQDLRKAWDTTVAEWLAACKSASSTCATHAPPELRYHAILSELGGFGSAERGSGLKTPLYANVLAWLYRDEEPKIPLLLSANSFGSDTDTIGTLAGALVGAVASAAPREELQDSAYIAAEARRMHAIGTGQKQLGFKYPDLLKWGAPKTQSEAWIHTGKDAELAGLGALQRMGPEFSSPRGPGLIYQWCELPFGQTILAKRKSRRNEKTVKAERIGAPSQAVQPGVSKVANESLVVESVDAPQTQNHGDTADKNISLDQRTRVCIKGNFDPQMLGENLLAVIKGSEGIEQAIAFAAIIAKAKIARDLR